MLGSAAMERLHGFRLSQGACYFFLGRSLRAGVQFLRLRFGGLLFVLSLGGMRGPAPRTFFTSGAPGGALLARRAVRVEGREHRNVLVTMGPTKTTWQLTLPNPHLPWATGVGSSFVPEQRELALQPEHFLPENQKLGFRAGDPEPLSRVLWPLMIISRSAEQ